MPEECSERRRIENIEKRLGDGDVSLATIDIKLEEVLQQTTRTNGRVTKLERFVSAVRWITIGVLGFVVAQRFGLLSVIARAVSN